MVPTTTKDNINMILGDSCHHTLTAMKIYKMFFNILLAFTYRNEMKLFNTGI